MAAYEIFANTPTTTVASGGTDAPSPGTVQTWTVSSSAGFPAAATGTSQFHVADPATGETGEMILVSNVAGTTWTVTRGVESTTPVAHNTGFTIYQVTTAGVFGSFAQAGFGDLGGSGHTPTVTSTHLSAALPVAQGGTGLTAAGSDGQVLATNSSGSVAWANTPVDWVNVVTAEGADPTGGTDSTTAIQNALNATPAGGVCYIPAGEFVTSSPLTVPAGVTLRGNQIYRAAANQNSYIRPKSTFSGAACIALDTGSPSSSVENLVIDGTNLSGGNSVNGINIAGAVKFWQVLGCQIRNFGQYGINIASSGGNPDGGYMRELSISGNGSHGIYWQYCVDGNAIMLHCDHNGAGGTGSGIYLNNLNNTMLISCKSQQNGSNGYELTGNGAKPSGTLVGCYSENNQDYGFSIHDLSNFSGKGGTVTLIGCKTADEGEAGTIGSGYSGYYVSNVYADVLFDGCQSDVSTTANGPDYGLKVASSSGYVAVSACDFLGALGGYHNGGGNTSVRFAGATTFNTGQSSANTTYLVPAAAAGFTPGDPSNTASTTLVMMGYGSTCTYTPAGSGNTAITATGVFFDTAAETGAIGARYGVLAGTAISVASGSSGGTISAVASWSSPSAGVLDVNTSAGYAAAGTVWVAASGNTVAQVTYSGTAASQLTGCAYVNGSPSGTVSTGSVVTGYPQNGAAVAGTRWGGAEDPSIGPTGASRPSGFAFTGLPSLTPNSTYWFDIAVHGNGGTVNSRNVSMTIAEQS